jgi:rhodanese-related sulfurtransferase
MTITTIRLALIAALALAAAGCSRQDAAAPPAPVRTVSVDELDRKIAAGQCQAVDANGHATRKRLGVIPGATLLSDHEAYQLSELPADKARPLVFYCANEHCGASHVAAARALTAGYTDVTVLPAGISGWRSAGKSIQQL